MPPRLELRGITKRYSAVLANDDVSLSVQPGEIHAVLGENGAGKSTLMKVVAGEVRPDAGTVSVDGTQIALRSPADARRCGVAMVHQHFALFDTLTVAENIALGIDESMPLEVLTRQIEELGARYGVPIAAGRHVHELSIGERQRVEILRALLARPRLLILDEPTSVLTPQAIAALFGTLRALAADGVSCLFISHKLDEIRVLASRCTVLRGGRVVASLDPAAVSTVELARLMIGADPPQIADHATPPGAARLVVHAALPPNPESDALDLTVRSGEIVGVAGISGNGQAELMALLSGETPVASAAITLDGLPIGHKSTRQRRALGLRYVPAERIRHGAVPELTLAENTGLTGDTFFSRRGLRRSAMRRYAQRIIDSFSVRTRGPRARAASLSGGNLQKFIVGREIESAPRVLIVDQPTWGVDVGAAAQIRNALIALRNAGCAIVVVSEEIDELYELADRIVVMAQGRLSPAVAPRHLPLEQLGRWMGGAWYDEVREGRADEVAAT
jgi:simple sugar transport system ATP-binding protein